MSRPPDQPGSLYSHIWTPGPESSHFRIRGTVDTLSLALAWTELPQFGLLLVVLDADHRVIRMVTDPSAEVVRNPALCLGAGLAPPVRGVAAVSMAPTDCYDPSTLFTDMQRLYRADGIRFVDWILIDFDPDGFRSMQLEARSRRRATARHLRAGVCV